MQIKVPDTPSGAITFTPGDVHTLNAALVGPARSLADASVVFDEMLGRYFRLLFLDSPHIIVVDDESGVWKMAALCPWAPPHTPPPSVRWAGDRLLTPKYLKDIDELQLFRIGAGGVLATLAEAALPVMRDYLQTAFGQHTVFVTRPRGHLNQDAWMLEYFLWCTFFPTSQWDKKPSD